ncbi:MAG TPA: CPBP family intramembrane glutamic endopeptidase [Candidatus Binataceae bacterium]|nr:CPBP family intramembrane glutamic endopeptidase [Candidatus Binataceae bacterium]
MENPSIAANVEIEGTLPRPRVRYPGLIEFFVLLGVGMLGWLLCSPVLPIPPDKHLRAISIALAESLFLVGLGCLAARRPGFSPTALRRWLTAAESPVRPAGLIYAAAGAAAVSILGTRVMQMIVVKALWAPALAAKTPPGIKEAGRKAFELFKAHPAAIGVGFPIIEEIHFRLFLMTALVWLITKLLRAPAGKLGAGGWWTAIAIQGLLFGAIHAATGEGTLWWEPRAVQMLLEPRAVAGIVLGYVYWRWGLETSILAHVFADLSVLCYLMLFAHGG